MRAPLPPPLHPARSVRHALLHAQLPLELGQVGPHAGHAVVLLGPEWHTCCLANPAPDQSVGQQREAGHGKSHGGGPAREWAPGNKEGTDNLARA